MILARRRTEHAVRQMLSDDGTRRLGGDDS
jgi:hypothetical protein